MPRQHLSHHYTTSSMNWIHKARWIHAFTFFDRNHSNVAAEITTHQTRQYFFVLVSQWGLANCSLSFLQADGSCFQCGEVKVKQSYFLFFCPFSLNSIMPRNSHVVVSEIPRSAYLAPKSTPHANWPTWPLFSIQIELWQFILTWLDVCANEKLKYKVTVRLDFVL